MSLLSIVFFFNILVAFIMFHLGGGATPGRAQGIRWCWGLEPSPPTCKAHALVFLSLLPHLCFMFAWGFRVAHQQC